MVKISTSRSEQQILAKIYQFLIVFYNRNSKSLLRIRANHFVMHIPRYKSA